MAYSESPYGVGSSKGGGLVANSDHHGTDTHIGPQGLPVFHDLDKGLAFAKQNNKPAFLDFTGHACVNCRKMEENVWGEPGVIEILTNDKKLFFYEWHVQKGSDNNCQNCWFTSAVSQPVDQGNTI